MKSHMKHISESQLLPDLKHTFNFWFDLRAELLLSNLAGNIKTYIETLNRNVGVDNSDYLLQSNRHYSIMTTISDY